MSILTADALTVDLHEADSYPSEADPFPSEFSPEPTISAIAPESRPAERMAGPKGAYEFQLPEPDAPDELFRRRYLTRGNAWQISAETGVGKSVFVYQGAVLWANGLPFLGFEPCRPLRILVIQAENDDGECAEIMNGIALGCRLTPEQRAAASRNVVFYRFKGGVVGAHLMMILRTLLERHRPDLLVLDPFSAFFDGDLAPRDVSRFYRQELRPLLEDFSVGCLVVHHFGKPPGVPAGRQVRFDNQHAYAGAGAAEQANFCRAVVSISATKDPHIFRIHYGKRGSRLPRRPSFVIQGENPTAPFWRELPEDEASSDTTSPNSVVAKLLNKIPPGQRIRKKEARCLFSEMGATRSAWESALEHAITQGYFVEEDVKQGKTKVRWMVRTSSPEAKP